MSKPISTLQAEYDLVIVGSGGGSMCAALAAKEQGKHAVILEKQAIVGGSTAYSGGVWWIPNNPLMARAGVPDSIDKARRYLDALVTYDGPASSKARREAYLKVGPEMVLFLERQGMKFRRPAEPWPDYYDDLPGGSAESRSLLARHFDRRKLGDWGDRLARYPPAVGVPMGADEFPVLLAVKTTWAGKRKAAKFALAKLKDRLTGAHTMTSGAAIQGRMLDISLKAGIEIYPESPVSDFVVEHGRVAGVRASHNGHPVEVRARDGVLVNAGGFSRNQALRDKYGRKPASSDWTSVNLGDTGDLLEAMIDLGAATDCLDTAWWVVTSRNVNGEWPAGAVHPDGSVYPFREIPDFAKSLDDADWSASTDRFDPTFNVPIVLYLVSEQCTHTHGVFSSNSGRYATVRTVVGDGWMAPMGPVAPTVEAVAAHFEQIVDKTYQHEPMTNFDEFKAVADAAKRQGLL